MHKLTVTICPEKGGSMTIEETAVYGTSVFIDEAGNLSANPTDEYWYEIVWSADSSR